MFIHFEITNRDLPALDNSTYYSLSMRMLSWVEFENEYIC